MQKKNTPNSAAATSIIVTSAAARLRLEKMRSGTNGFSWRRSISTNAAISSAAAAKPPSVRPDAQPHDSASISTYTSATVPSVMAMAPPTS